MSNSNNEWELLTGKPSPFSTDIGSRFRVQCVNAESLLIHEEDVKKIVRTGNNEHVTALKNILDDKENLDEILCQASIPMLLWRLVLDNLHTAFSSTNNYGWVKSKLNEAKNAQSKLIVSFLLIICLSHLR